MIFCWDHYSTETGITGSFLGAPKLGILSLETQIGITGISVSWKCHTDWIQNPDIGDSQSLNWWLTSTTRHSSQQKNTLLNDMNLTEVHKLYYLRLIQYQMNLCWTPEWGTTWIYTSPWHGKTSICSEPQDLV